MNSDRGFSLVQNCRFNGDLEPGAVDRGQFNCPLFTDHCPLIPVRSKTMAISKQKKQEKVQRLAKELETSTTAIIGTFAKLTVAQGFRTAQGDPRSGRQVSRGQEQAGGSFGARHQGRGRAEGSEGRELGGLHLRRSGGAGQGALPSGSARTPSSSSSWASSTARCSMLKRSRRWRPCRARKRSFQAAVPHQCPGAASGDGDQRHRPRSGRGAQPGRGEGKVCCGSAA